LRAVADRGVAKFRLRAGTDGDRTLGHGIGADGGRVRALRGRAGADCDAVRRCSSSVGAKRGPAS
jgi:hypothetical protein